MKRVSNKTFKNIVVCGDVGTGTSTLTKGLARKLGWRFVSAGDIFRSYCKKHKIPLWNKLALPDELDKKVDYEFLERMKNENQIVFDSHYSGWFARNLPNVFKILLICEKQEATSRIIARQHTLKELPKEIEERRIQLREKFKKLYSNDDYEEPKLFHLVIDTTKTSVEEVVQKAFEEFRKS